MEIKKFKVEFVQRTQSLLTEYQGSSDMSNLINCTLGLIILPYESIKSNPPSFWNRNISKIPDLPHFHLTLFEPIKDMKGSVITF